MDLKERDKKSGMSIEFLCFLVKEVEGFLTTCDPKASELPARGMGAIIHISGT